MPEWNPPPETALRNALDEAWNQLAEQVAGDDPAFEDVIGLEAGALTGHALHAVTVFAMNHPGGADQLGATATLIQIYCLGFVVGAKYGEQRKRRTSD